MNQPQNKDTALASDLTGFKLLGRLDREQRNFMASACLRRSVKKGAVLCEPGSQPAGVFYQLEGKTKLAVLSARGSERVIKIVDRADTFGEAFVFHTGPFPVYAQALEASRLLLIRRESIAQAIARWPRLALPMFDQIGEFTSSILKKFEACCLQNAQQRVASFLINNSERGKEGKHLFEVMLPAGKALVASSLNLTPETFSRELHQLTLKGLIDTDRRTILIRDMAGLRSICA